MSSLCEQYTLKTFEFETFGSDSYKDLQSLLRNHGCYSVLFLIKVPGILDWKRYKLFGARTIFRARRWRRQSGTDKFESSDLFNTRKSPTNRSVGLSIWNVQSSRSLGSCLIAEKGRVVDGWLWHHLRRNHGGWRLPVRPPACDAGRRVLRCAYSLLVRRFGDR